MILSLTSIARERERGERERESEREREREASKVGRVSLESLSELF